MKFKIFLVLDIIATIICFLVISPFFGVLALTCTAVDTIKEYSKDTEDADFWKILSIIVNLLFIVSLTGHILNNA